MLASEDTSAPGRDDVAAVHAQSRSVEARGWAATAEPGRMADVSVRQPNGRRVIGPPAALLRLASGFDQLAAVLAVTLGPVQGPVLNARPGGSVEVLSDAGTIARRVVELPGRGRNTGAMILRNLAWSMHEQFGDGAATAAVLARAMVAEAVKRIEAGIDPTLIRGGLEHALPAALASLEAQSLPAAGSAMLTAVATGLTGDPALGPVLGEIVDLLGPDGGLTIEEFPIPYLDREYIEGAYWRAHPAARAMIPEGQREVLLDNPLIMVADQELGEVEDVRLALEYAARPMGRRPLLIVPAKMGERALNAVTVNLARGTVTAIAALLARAGPAQTDDLADMALLTGGKVLGDVLGRSPRRVQWEDLGTARRAVVSRESLTIVDGAGDRTAVAERLASLRRMVTVSNASEDERKRLQGRLARLSGSIAILKLGAHSRADLAHQRARAERAFRVLTGIAADGVVPGGGVAYLDCLAAVRATRATCPLPGQEHGVDVLAAALDGPFRQIVHNRGIVHPPVALAAVTRLGCGYGLDVRTGEYVDLRQRGILDSLRVARGSLQLAASTAISVFATGVVVLPPESKRALRVKP